MNKSEFEKIAIIEFEKMILNEHLDSLNLKEYLPLLEEPENRIKALEIIFLDKAKKLATAINKSDISFKVEIDRETNIIKLIKKT